MFTRITIKHVVLPAILLAGISANLALGQAMPKAQVGNLIKKVEDGVDQNRRLRGINVVDEFWPIIIEHGAGITFIRDEALADEFEIGIVEAVFAQCPPLQTFDQFIKIRTSKVEHRDDIDNDAESWENDQIDLRVPEEPEEVLRKP